ncbi:MAG: ABC transporter ATP-binding protein [Planctomycetota bacterium]|nr:ABC transporter ATP-binding protein [Planctomycetota bacterium]
MIKLNNVRKDYRSGNNTTTIVDVDELNISAGEKVAIVGASGSGKTTLLNLLSGLVVADQGQIVIDGQDITTLSESGRDRFRANNIGYLFQNFHLLDGYSALENVELGMLFASGAVKSQRAAEQLTKLGLGQRLHHQPSELSIGQQARVALARATVNNPKIILADEPTGALDSESAREALDLLFEQSASHNSTLICVTHDKSVAANFDRILDMGQLQ